MTGRAAFDLVGYMAGVVTSTGSLRDGTVNGLTQASVNITLDGMNIQDNYAKTWDGMFTRVSPRIDAVEEVTVTTAAQGADTAGQGSVQMRFVTRSGTNKLQGSAYYYLRRDWMNTNTWFNENKNVTTDGKPADKPTVNLRQPGGRIGGPVVIPGLFDGHDKMFFFVNYELLDSPGSSGSTRTIMSPLTEQGVFQYGAGRTVNLLDAGREERARRHDRSDDREAAGRHPRHHVARARSPRPSTRSRSRSSGSSRPRAGRPTRRSASTTT